MEASAPLPIFFVGRVSGLSKKNELMLYSEYANRSRPVRVLVASEYIDATSTIPPGLALQTTDYLQAWLSRPQITSRLGSPDHRLPPGLALRTTDFLHVPCQADLEIGVGVWGLKYGENTSVFW